MSDTGIIDKYLRIGIALENLMEHGADRGVIRDIAGEGMNRRMILLLQLPGQGLQPIHLFVPLQKKTVAAAGKAPGERLTDAAGSSGNDCGRCGIIQENSPLHF